MKCHYCSHPETKVIDSRENEDVTRRRRECLKCAKRFTTYEQVDAAPTYVIKKDGSREPFNAEKLRKGLLKACEKRPVSIEQINAVIAKLEAKVHNASNAEIASKALGEEVIRQIKRLDKVAYVRFASVYREFADVSDFKKEIQELVKNEKKR